MEVRFNRKGRSLLTTPVFSIEETLKSLVKTALVLPDKKVKGNQVLNPPIL